MLEAAQALVSEVADCGDEESALVWEVLIEGADAARASPPASVHLPDHGVAFVLERAARRVHLEKGLGRGEQNCSMRQRYP